MFDDFDIDYNKMKYLIETRCSGAMIKPYGAVAIEFVSETASLTQERRLNFVKKSKWSDEQ